MERKTPLYDVHLKNGGKMVSFAGYLLPVQYEGVIAEHLAVRHACGIFDVSHMGEILCMGKDAEIFLNQLLTNDFSHMFEGQAKYSPMCNEKGTVVDDLIVYKIREHHYMLVVNAANREKDFQWIKEHLKGNVVLKDISDSVAQIALQGPNAEKILRKVTAPQDIPEKYYSANFNSHIQGIPCMISRTGYTGEKGYECYVSSENGEKLWDLFMEQGREYGLVPCGLGARDTLRLEAAMPLYGHEIDETITPLETGLGSFVKLEKENFVGKKALLEKGKPDRCRVGIKITGKGIIREKMEIYAKDRKIGISTSGTHCPYLGYSAGMALVECEYGNPGNKVEVSIRGRKVPAEIVPLPFYKCK